MYLKIYEQSVDVSAYINEHPGGQQILRKYINSNVDATTAFKQTGHSQAAVMKLSELSGCSSLPVGHPTHRIGKLVTHEDSYHLHKICGMVAMSHFVICYYRFASSGGTTFGVSAHNWSSALMVIHGLLALLGLRFPVEEYRIQGTQNMTTEQVYHTVVFSFRSIMVYFMPSARIPIVLFHHFLSDIVTHQYHHAVNGTTIRGGIAESWVPSWMLVVRNYYAGIAQFGAIIALLGPVQDTGDAAMLSLLPIQIGAFANTLTKKHIIGSLGHGIIYGSTLLVSYVYTAINYPSVLLWACLAMAARIQRINKYLVMGVVCFIYHTSNAE